MPLNIFNHFIKLFAVISRNFKNITMLAAIFCGLLSVFYMPTHTIASGHLNQSIFKGQLGDDLKDAKNSQAKAYFLKAKQDIDVDNHLAISSYYEKMANNSDVVGFKAYFARLLYESGHLISASDYVNQALTADYDQKWFYAYFGNSLLKEGNLFLASKVINQGIKKWPKDSNLVWLDILITADLNPEKALTKFSFLQNLDEMQYIFKHDLEKILNKKSEAIQTIRQGLTFYPKSVLMHQKMILIFLETGDEKNAIKSIQTAQKNAEPSADIYNLEAVLYEATKNYEKALFAIKQAVLLAPDNASHQASLARIYWLMGDYDNSAVLMQKLVDQNIAELSFYQRLSRYYQTQNRPFTAEQIILKGLNLVNNYADVYGISFEDTLVYEYAVIQETKGNHQSAILNLNDLLIDNANNNSLHYSLARNYFRIGDHSKAIYHLDKIMQNLQANNSLAHFKEDVVGLYLEVLIALKKFQDALDLVDQHYPSSVPAAISAAKMRIYFYSENYKLAKQQLDYHILEHSETYNYQLKYLNATLAQLSQNNQKVLEVLKSINQGNVLYKKSHLLVSEFRSSINLHTNNQDEKTLAEYFQTGQPNLMYVELSAYLDKSYLNRAWKDSKPTLKAFEAIILGQPYVELLAKVPQKWQSFLQLLADSFLIYPTVKNFDIELTSQSEPWQVVYYYYANLKNPDFDSKEVFNKLSSFLYKNPNDPWLNYILASDYHINDKKYLKAVAFFKKFLRIYPYSVWAKIELAICYDSLSMDKKAEGYLLEVLRVDADNPTAINNLAWLYLTSDDASLLDTQKALVMAEKAVFLQSNSAFWDTLAEAYFQNSQYEQAEAAIQRALVLDASKSDHFKRQLIKIRKKTSNASFNVGN